jgi:DNA repair protein RecO (recombination protein O)
MQVDTKALVFSSVKYGEADLIVTCYTEKFGLKSYLLRAILKSKKGKLRASLFQPLTLLQLNAYHKDKGTLERIQDAQILFPYKSMHTQVVKTSLVMFLSEILKNSVKEEEANPELFQFLASSLEWLDENVKIANFHLVFLLKLTGHLGFYPDFSDSELPYFNLMDGVFQNNPSGDFSEGGPSAKIMIKLHHCTLDDISALTIAKNDRMDVLQLLLKYYQLHVQDYRTPRSLSVLTQLFH